MNADKYDSHWNPDLWVSPTLKASVGVLELQCPGGLSAVPSWVTLRTAHRQSIVFCFLTDENGTKSKMNGIKICFK